MSSNQQFYHVTTLSNFALAYDKYRRLYRKSAISASRYPNEFYLLSEKDIEVGITKALALRDKIGLPGDRPLILETTLPRDLLQPHPRNGIGIVWPSPDLPVIRVHEIGSLGKSAIELRLEEAMAKSLALHARSFVPYGKLRPRSISFLPIARGCQAACPFCFSEASASLDQRNGKIDWAAASKRWIDRAFSSGAERAVITGGGEPMLMPWTKLLGLIRLCRAAFSKVVLITNGVRLAEAFETDPFGTLLALQDAGLSVLAISRHHVSEIINSRLMKLQTDTPSILRNYAMNISRLSDLSVRLICVLQRGGVETVADVDDYVTWAASFDIHEVCFKELYVSTTVESVYHSARANKWSAENQVSLSIVHDWAAANNFTVQSRLPWGAPAFGGTISSKPMSVAAYTEPSLFWERSSGIARSWNVMADGTCLASLEDRRSVVENEFVEELI